MTAAIATDPQKKGHGGYWILTGLILGIVLGGFFPQSEYPQAFNFFRFCSKAFIALIKGLIVPLVFSTLVVGIAQTKDLKAIGRMGIKSLIYFEIVTTIALFLGLFIANWVRPGDGLPLPPSGEAVIAAPQSGWDIAMHLFPSNLIKHAADGDLLPIVVFAVLFGISLTQVISKHQALVASQAASPNGGPHHQPLHIASSPEQVLTFLEWIAQTMFRYTEIVMKLTPIGVFGAMAYNVSHMASGHEVNGHMIAGWPAVIHLLGQYAKLVGSLYFALLLLIGLVFIPVLLSMRVKPLAFFKAIREPAICAYTTASSEAALPSLLEEVVKFGVPRRVASFVLPAGYSFNLDGSTLYLVLASLTIAQAAHIELSLTQQISMVLVFMLTSKGVAGVPRATLVIIAGTCASFGLPGEAGVAMLLAVDEIMDMARTLTNVIGNGVASVVIAKWEGVFGLPDTQKAKSD